MAAMTTSPVDTAAPVDAIVPVDTVPTAAPLPAADPHPTADSVGRLLAGVAAGDPQAFAALYTDLQHRVFGLVYTVLRDHQQAQEVTQEIFLQLWLQAAKFDSSRGSGQAWILQMAHARAVDRVRKCQSSSVRDTRYLAAGHVPDIDSVMESVLLRHDQLAVRSALQRLTAGQRESIVLAYYCGMTTQQISDHVGINRATIKTRIRDGLLKLGVDLRQSLPVLAKG